MYIWENSNIKAHLDCFDYMSQKEYKKWLESQRYGIRIGEIVELSENYPISSFEFTNSLMKLLFENMGDYDDLLPYNESSIAKLNDEEQAFFQNASDLIKQELEHVKIRRASFI